MSDSESLANDLITLDLSMVDTVGELSSPLLVDHWDHGFGLTSEYLIVDLFLVV